MVRCAWVGTLRFAALALGFYGATSAPAAVIPGGDTILAGTSSQNSIVGNHGIGTLAIDGGSWLSNSFGYLGYNAGSTGEATVSGPNSAWGSGLDLYVGNYGNGKLRIQDGGWAGWGASGLIGFGSGSTGTVNVSGAMSALSSNSDLFVGYFGDGALTVEGGGAASNSGGYVGYKAGSTGTVTISGVGSTWTNSSNLYVGSSGNGTLTIKQGAQVSNRYAYVGNLSGSSGQVTVSGSGSKWINGTFFDVGFYGSGALTIEDGAQVSNTQGTVGATIGSKGLVTVSGAGSAWTNGADLYVASSGIGTLNIRAGGQVSNTFGHVAADFNSTGAVTVTGPGSRWTNSTYLFVGDHGRGTLTVADGGKVTARNLAVNNYSTIRVHVSRNDMLVLGDSATVGSIANYGTVAVYANAFLPSGIYSPITEYAGRPMDWFGTGAKAIGGAWDEGAKTLSVGLPIVLSAGDTHGVVTDERVLFADAATGRRAGASFGTITHSTNFSATRVTGGPLSTLGGLLRDDEQVLGAWDFATNFNDGEVMLSFDIGLGAHDLSVWHLDGGVWSAYTPSLLTYDADGIASFTVNSFSGYAVTGVVPEPDVVGLLVLSLRAMRRGRR